MKQYNTYYDSELDSWVIDNSNIEQGEFTEDTRVLRVQEVLDRLETAVANEDYHIVMKLINELGDEK